MFDLYILLGTSILGIFAVLSVFFLVRNFEWSVVFLFIAPSFSAFFGADMAEDQFNIGSYLRIAFVGLASIAAIIVYFKNWNSHHGKMPFHLLIFFLIYVIAFFSFTYSIDPNATIIRSVNFLSLCIYLIGLNVWISDLNKVDRILKLLFYTAAILIFINILSMIVLPDRAWWVISKNRFIGLLDHPNTMGSFCVTSFAILYYHYDKSTFSEKKLILIGILVLLVMVFLTGSRTSLFTLFIGTLIWLISQRKMLKVLITLSLFISALFFIIVMTPDSFHRKKGDEITNLTGRDKFWQAATILILEKPFSGYGYGVAGKIWQDPRFYDPERRLWSGSSDTSLHNGYISIAVGLGLPLFFIWLTVVILPFTRILPMPRDNLKSLILYIGTVGLMSNFVESAITSISSFYSILFWIVWIIAGKSHALWHAKVNTTKATP